MANVISQRKDDHLRQYCDLENHSVDKTLKEVEATKVITSIDVVLQIIKKRFGISHVEYAELQEKKAICLSVLRKYDDTTKSLKKSLVIFIDKYGSNHVSVLNGLFNIGVCLKDKGDTNKPIAYLEKARK